MAIVHENWASVVLINTDTNRATGLYTVNNIPKVWTGSNCCQDALDDVSKVLGNDEYKIIQEVARSYTEVITTSP